MADTSTTYIPTSVYIAPSYRFYDRLLAVASFILLLALLALLIACLVFIKRERDAMVEGQKALEGIWAALLHMQAAAAPPPARR
jgi:hypothetical protein